MRTQLNGKQSGKAKTELLAPAGDMVCLRAAFAAGADAVYLGGQKFGARAFAGNFTDEELIEALQLAHFLGKKIYLTVNTLMKEAELEELVLWLTPFYEAGLDGLIIQDLGALERCRRAFPKMEMHASTQMTVTESRTALFLKSLGVSRIVPARELSLEELRQMKEETGLELETFIHGALCYCYSGQCLFSSFLGGRSGNRGRCAQPCRLPYTVSDRQLRQAGSGRRESGKKEQYPLSLKDLCVLPFLPKLLDAGIDSFKIEGRMKSPEYVAGVTALYRKYMDLYEKDPVDFHVAQEDLEVLTHLYVRSELGGGYYGKHNGKEMVTMDKPGYAGCKETVLEEIRQKYLQKELTKEVNLSIRLAAGQPVTLTAACENVRVVQQGMEGLPARKKPLAKADVEKQLRKTGGSHFRPGTLEIEMGDNVFLPVAALNELRRQALDALYIKMSQGMMRTPPEASERQEAAGAACAGESGQQTELFVSALEVGQALAAVRQSSVGRLYLAADAVLLSRETEELLEAVRNRKQATPSFTFFLTLPVILRSYSRGYFSELAKWLACQDHEKLVDGMMACSLSGLLWAEEYGWKKKRSLSASAYVYNRETWAFYMRHFRIDTYTVPLELNRHEMATLPVENQEMTVYGRIPMMVTAGCVKKTAGVCQVRHTAESLKKGLRSRSLTTVLKDRYQAEFPVLVNCLHCMNTIYNSVPLSLHQYLEDIRARRIRAVRLEFTDETAEETAKMIRFFADGNGMPPASYTTGHYKKGVQ